MRVATPLILVLQPLSIRSHSLIRRVEPDSIAIGFKTCPQPVGEFTMVTRVTDNRARMEGCKLYCHSGIYASTGLSSNGVAEAEEATV